MIDHIGLRTARFKDSKQFFMAALAPLGIVAAAEYPSSVGFARDGTIKFWLGASTSQPSSMHLAFQAPSRAAVDAFHAAAIVAGAIDNGAPGLRVDYHEHYYAAFVIDQDGNNVEAVCHQA